MRCVVADVDSVTRCDESSVAAALCHWRAVDRRYPLVAVSFDGIVNRLTVPLLGVAKVDLNPATVFDVPAVVDEESTFFADKRRVSGRAEVDGMHRGRKRAGLRLPKQVFYEPVV